VESYSPTDAIYLWHNLWLSRTTLHNDETIWPPGQSQYYSYYSISHHFCSSLTSFFHSSVAKTGYTYQYHVNSPVNQCRLCTPTHLILPIRPIIKPTRVNRLVYSGSIDVVRDRTCENTAIHFCHRMFGSRTHLRRRPPVAGRRTEGIPTLTRDAHRRPPLRPRLCGKPGVKRLDNQCGRRPLTIGIGEHYHARGRCCRRRCGTVRRNPSPLHRGLHNLHNELQCIQIA
jgi:hypothetical protein